MENDPNFLALPKTDMHPERSTEPPETEVRMLGRSAASAFVVGEVPIQSDTNKNITQLEASTNEKAPQEDHRIHDINEAYEAALRENEIFDAHVAALKEDAEREQARATEEARALDIPAQNVVEGVTENQLTTRLETSSPEEIHKETVAALKQMGLDIQIPPGSEISKDTKGNLFIVSGNDAKAITYLPNGSPRVTEYHYDKDSATLTIDGRTLNVYANRALEGVPSVITKRLGIAQARVREQYELAA
jgi:hypothetical protein